jgi:hypothetical protein
MRRPYLAAAGFSLAIVVARLLGAPALSDPTGTALPPGLHLHFPALNLILAPLFDLWDGVSMLGMRRLRAFFIWSAAFFALWQLARLAGRVSLRRAAKAVLLVVAFVMGLGLWGLVGLVWHRPMASLASVPAGTLVVDFHTHTNVSHDVRSYFQRGFDAEAARRWHARSGFDAFFVTDHNRIDGIPAGGGPADARPALCPGEEVSAADQHVVLLVNTVLVDNHAYGDSLPGILRLLADAGPKYGAIAIASIPEYDKNHFHDLDRFVAAGVGGFEVVNAAPKANELTRAHRDTVIALARARNVPILGVSDSHGWGATIEGWTLIRPSAATTPGPGRFPAICGAILTELRQGGFAATQIVERHRLRPDAWWPEWATPFGVVWESWRALGMGQLVAWLVWCWAIAALVAAGYRRRQGRI